MFQAFPNAGGTVGEVIYVVTRNNGNTFTRTFIDPVFAEPGLTLTLRREITYATDANCGTPCDVSTVSATSSILDELGNMLNFGADPKTVSPSDVLLIDKVPCSPGPTTACLANNRFKVEINYVDPLEAFFLSADVVNTNPAIGRADFLLDGLTGFDAFVQIIDRCPVAYDLLYGDTTGVEHTITVIDTDTGVGRQVYHGLDISANARLPNSTLVPSFGSCFDLQPER